MIYWVALIYSVSRNHVSDISVHQIPQQSIVQKEKFSLIFVFEEKYEIRNGLKIINCYQQVSKSILNQHILYSPIFLLLWYNTDYDKTCVFPKNIFEVIGARIKEGKRQFIVRENTALALIFDVTNGYLIKRMNEI